MFSDEYTVTVRTRGGEKVSVFVPRDAAEEQSGRVRVLVAEQEGTTVARLPDAHHSVVEVEASDLQPA
jgi:hypothetical protein